MEAKMRSLEELGKEMGREMNYIHKILKMEIRGNKTEI